MIRRQTAFFAGIAAFAVAAAFAAAPAQALTIENYSGATGAPTRGFVDLNYNDPNKKPAKNGDKRTLDTGPQFKFGPSEPSFNSRYNSNDYFTPNYLMGK